MEDPWNLVKLRSGALHILWLVLFLCGVLSLIALIVKYGGLTVPPGSN